MDGLLSEVVIQSTQIVLVRTFTRIWSILVTHTVLCSPQLRRNLRVSEDFTVNPSHAMERYRSSWSRGVWCENDSVYIIRSELAFRAFYTSGFWGVSCCFRIATWCSWKRLKELISKTITLGRRNKFWKVLPAAPCLQRNMMPVRMQVGLQSPYTLFTVPCHSLPLEFDLPPSFVVTHSFDWITGVKLS